MPRGEADESLFDSACLAVFGVLVLGSPEDPLGLSYLNCPKAREFAGLFVRSFSAGP